MKRKHLLVLFVVVLLALLLLFYKMSSSEKDLTYGLVMPKGYTIHGIDVSRYQGKIDWRKLAQMKSGKDSIPITFAFIKATEGRSITDATFAYNWKESRKNNIVRGAYHYFIPNRDAKEQVANFIKNVKLQAGDLPPVLDVEVVGPGGKKKLQENILIWMKAIEKHYKMKPILYTYIDFYEKNLSGTDFSAYPLWIAHYYKSTLQTDDEWILWQHSDKGIIEGVANEVDFNVFNGGMNSFNKLKKP